MDTETLVIATGRRCGKAQTTVRRVYTGAGTAMSRLGRAIGNLFGTKTLKLGAKVER